MQGKQGLILMIGFGLIALTIYENWMDEIRAIFFNKGSSPASNSPQVGGGALGFDLNVAQGKGTSV